MTKGTLEPPCDTSLGWGLCPRGWAQGPLLWLLHWGISLGWQWGFCCLTLTGGTCPGTHFPWPNISSSKELEMGNCVMAGCKVSEKKTQPNPTLRSGRINGAHNAGEGGGVMGRLPPLLIC